MKIDLQTYGPTDLRTNRPTDGPTDGLTDGPTEEPTDGRTDTPSYRDATAHLKMLLNHSNEFQRTSKFISWRQISFESIKKHGGTKDFNLNMQIFYTGKRKK